MSLRCVVWNAEWARPDSLKGRRFAAKLAALAPDVVCLTEGFAGLMPAGGVTETGPVPGNAPRSDARRVLLWSRFPMRDVDGVGHPDLPHEAWVSATLDTPLGDVSVACVCIPWWDAEVARFGGTKDRWQVHMEYLALLPEVMAPLRDRGPLVVAGDYNQFLPPAWAPKVAAQALADAFTGMPIATTGATDPGGRGLIDHLAHTPNLTADVVETWGGWGDSGPMSDHSGVLLDIRRGETSRPPR